MDSWFMLLLLGLTAPLSIGLAYRTVRLLGFTIGAGLGGGTVGLLLVPLVAGGYLALSIFGVRALMRTRVYYKNAPEVVAIDVQR